MPAASYLDNLNSAQKRAVTFGEPVEGGGWKAGPLLVVAGAGTGKTSTIAHRVAQLVLNGVDPSRLLLLTFTRRAAVEMRRRAHEIVRDALDQRGSGKGNAVLQRLQWAGTFHSIGNRLLRLYARQLKLDPSFTVVDRADSADLLDDLRAQLGMASKEQRFPRKDTCLAIYSWRINTQKSLKDTLEQQFPWCKSWEEELTRLFRGYVERKQRYSLLDYDDLLLYWHMMMGEARIAQHVGTHFDHILVDEYQDTNKLQGDILLALRPDGAGLTVVGDDAQAIYSFRAAAVENILQFPERFRPRAEIISLAQNYRSTQLLLDASNALMADAPKQFRKNLLSVRGPGSRAFYVTLDDLTAQAEYVCGEILRRRESGVLLRRQAVLFRHGSASDVLEIELARRKIPFVKYGGLKFLEAAHIKDVLAVLRWADNLRNSLSAFRVLQLLPGIGPVNARKCVELLEGQGGSVEALKGYQPGQALAIDYGKLVALMQALTVRERPWPGQIREVRDWYQPHLERLYEQVHTRRADLDQLEQLSANYPSRERFISELTLDPPNATSDLAGSPLHDEDYLVLSTVHSAKGMEWDTVYVLNVVDGSFPSEFATSRAELIEEERRLLYVAMTRARNELQLCVPLKFPLSQQPKTGDAHVYGGRSRFVSEKMLKTLQPIGYQSNSLTEAVVEGAEGDAALDVAARLKEMW
ncbi:MAG TPA: ATP-dependent helicase [Steroidobacteraceae bacterium]|nr:ATP-dependent helicase [Steroidobacteraceae bacterium]